MWCQWLLVNSAFITCSSNCSAIVTCSSFLHLKDGWRISTVMAVGMQCNKSCLFLFFFVANSSKYSSSTSFVMHNFTGSSKKHSFQEMSFSGSWMFLKDILSKRGVVKGYQSVTTIYGSLFYRSARLKQEPTHPFCFASIWKLWRSLQNKLVIDWTSMLNVVADATQSLLDLSNYSPLWW